MLYRILNVRQDRKKGFKIWFTDDYWDLFLWLDDSKQIDSFQLGFGKPSDEQLIIWEKGSKKLKTARVESGETHPGRNQSPLLKQGTKIDMNQVLSRFKKDSRKIDPKIVQFVAERLAQ